MLEQKLHEELMRYNQINRYGKKMIMEQDAPPTDIPPVPGDAPAADAGAPAPTDTPAPPAPDAPADTPPAPDNAGLDAPSTDSTEELDITDLVDMVKSIKQDHEEGAGEHTQVLTKMDDVFTKLNDLESKLSEMDQIMSKIDELGHKVEEMKPQSPQEKLEMRSLDSYPFNEKPQEFFAHKQAEMKASGKNEYVLTKNEVENYPFDQIKNSFNPDEQDEHQF